MINTDGGDDTADAAMVFHTSPNDTAISSSTERMRIDKDGNVGIGTDDPSENLHIKSTASAHCTLMIEAATDNYDPEIRLKSQSDEWLIRVNDDTGGGATDNQFNIWNGSDWFTILPTGQVGLYRTVPRKTLDVNGSIYGQGSANLTITGTIDATASTTVTGVGTKFTQQLALGDDLTLLSGEAEVETRTVTAIASDTSLTVHSAFSNLANDTSPQISQAGLSLTRSNGTTSTMVVDYDGNVGIGTAAPTQLLDVEGAGTATIRVHSTDGSAQLIIESNAETNNSTIHFESGDASDGRIYYDPETGQPIDEKKHGGTIRPLRKYRVLK